MNLANRITLFRILLVPALILVVLYWDNQNNHLRWFALLIFSVACITDAIDGYLARKKNMITRLGSLMDPLADKILLVTAYLSLSYVQHIPAEYQIPGWLSLLVVSRDSMLIAGALLIFFTQNKFDVKTNYLGKVTTVFQMTLIAIILLGFPEGVRYAFMGMTAILTITSGASYIRAGAKYLSNGSVT